MKKLFCIDVPQFLYAHGIPNASFDEVYLVQVAKDETRDGVRPFSETLKIMNLICQELNLPLKVLPIENVKLSKIIESGDVVDIQIVTRLKGFRVPKGASVLCAQVEHINIMRPSVFKFLTRSFRKRYDLNKGLIWGKKIERFYSLARQPKSNLFLEEISLDSESIRVLRVKLLRALFMLHEYQKLRSQILQNNNKDGLIVLLRAEHFGGTVEFNRKILEFVLTISQSNPRLTVIVKNHPSDPFNYRDFGVSLPGWIFLNELEYRFFPIELLVEAFDSYRFIGVESTVYLSLAEFVESKTIIVSERNWKKKKEISYVNGEILKMYSHELEIFDSTN